MPPLLFNVSRGIFPFLWHAIGWLVDALPDIFNLILVLVGVIMSLPRLAERIEEHKIARYTLAFGCILLGLFGFVVSVYHRRQATSQMTTLVSNVSTLVTNTNTAVTNTNTMVSTFALLMPQFNVLNARIADIDVKIAAAKGNPPLIATLQKQAAELRKQSETASRKVLLAMVPIMVSQLRDLASAWYNVLDGIDLRYRGVLLGERNARIVKANNDFLTNVRSPMIMANELRMQLLNLLSSKTQVDQTEARVFAKVVAGEAIEWQDVKSAAEYLDQLATRVLQATPSN